MSDPAVQLIIAAFDDENAAEEALHELKAAKKEHLIAVQAAIAIQKDEDGVIHSKEVGLTPGKGALGGVVLGAALGVITGGASLALGALGAILGSVVGRKKRDSRFSSDRLNQVAISMPPHSSAIVAVVDADKVDELAGHFESTGADVLTADITDDIVSQLQALQKAEE